MAATPSGVAVLLTGVGKRYALVSVFAQHAVTIAADPNPLAPARYAAHHRRSVPRFDDNHVVSAYTDQGQDPGANNIELETVQPIALPGSGSRFLVFSADVAAATCGNQRPSPSRAVVMTRRATLTPQSFVHRRRLP